MRRLISLCSILVSIALLPLAPPAPAQSAARAASPDWQALQSEAVQQLSAYIAVNTTNPPGHEILAAQWYAKIFRAEGIPFEIAESAPGRGNIVARLKGTAPSLP